LRKKLDFDGIFGFVRFVECYYLILITKKSPVALIGGHYINHIDDTVMIPIHFNSKTYAPSPQEQRYFQIFNQVDRTKNFYFSYTYDLTRSLQSNMTQGWEKITPKTMFLWNEFLTSDVFDDYSMWYIPIIHGFVDQASTIDFKSEISVFGHNILITLIARRSKYFAGARFLKRGVSDKGYVANDVETEQIVHDASRTLFSCPQKNSLNNTAYTSFLQHRGSIPLFWSQDISPMAAKPQIESINQLT
jgi:phosphatidylinositol 3,5-bisphosphate 5-phosphatase